MERWIILDHGDEPFWGIRLVGHYSGGDSFAGALRLACRAYKETGHWIEVARLA